jgi:hypothetical protein
MVDKILPIASNILTYELRCFDWSRLDCNRAEDGREPTIEPNKQKTIGIAELGSLRYLSAKHVELLAKD